MEEELLLGSVEYKKDIHHHYMILKDEQGIDMSCYEIRMLLANQIEGLLPSLIQRIDGQMYYYFDITSCENMHQVFQDKKYSGQDLKRLFCTLLELIKSLQVFLLESSHLVLNSRFIFCDQEDKYCFTYITGYQKDLQEGIRELTEYLLPKIDHQDRDAVSLGYGVYRCSMDAHMTLERLEEEIYKTDRKKESVNTWEEDAVSREFTKNPQEEQARQEAFRSLFEEEWEEESLWNRLKSLIRQKRNKKKESLPQWLEEAKEKDETMCLVSYQTVPYASEKCFFSLHKEKYPDFSLHKDVLFVGKASSNVDVSLDFPAVSRLHARILQRNGQTYIVDMHSKNGTRVNGEILIPDKEYELHDKDQIEFADLIYEYRM